MKGIDKLIVNLAMYGCPSENGLKDFNRIEKPNYEFGQCIYGASEHFETCIDCFKKSLEKEYED